MISKCHHPTRNGEPEICMFQAHFSTFHMAKTMQWFSCMKISVTILKSLLFHAWTMHDSWSMHEHIACRDLGHFTMHVTCMNYCLYFMHASCKEYSCSVHGIWPISCIFHVWYWRLPCVVQAYSKHSIGVFYVYYRHIPCAVQTYFMCGTGVFHARYRRIPCPVQAYSMRGTDVFHVRYRRIPCAVQAYSMRGTGVFHGQYRCVFTVHGTSIPMHAPCTVQAYSQHYIYM